MNCHGGRKDDSSFNNPASTTVQSGAVHGTTIVGTGVTEQGNAPAYTARFRSATASPTARRGTPISTTSRATEALGCQTTATDNYSSCNKHNGGTTKANPANYNYGP